MYDTELEIFQRPETVICVLSGKLFECIFRCYESTCLLIFPSSDISFSLQSLSCV